MIYAIGNSHVNIFSGKDNGFFHPGESPGFKSFPMGPTIAYNFTEHHLPKIEKIIEDYQIPKGSKILLVVGEVDCRWHIPFQAHKQNRQTGLIIDECLSRFFKTFLTLSEMGYEPMGWGTHPTTNRPHSDDQSEPVFGDIIYRNGICLFWNEYLRGKCNRYGFEYKSIYPYLVYPNNMTRTEYFQDYCHLSTEKVRPFIDKEFGVIS